MIAALTEAVAQAVSADPEPGEGWGGLIVVILVVGATLLLNALFVAAEFAALGVRRSRMSTAAAAGSRSARLMLPFVSDVVRLDRYISSCQLGITATSIGLGAYGENAIAHRLEPLLGSGVAAHSAAVAIVIVALTVFQVVLAEQVPKSIALHRPERVAMFTVWPVVFFQTVLGVVITFLNGSARAVLWMLRAPAVVHRHVHSRQEIDLIIEQSRDKGTIEADQHDRLQQVLDLEVVTARQLMIPRREIAALDIETHANDGVQVIIDRQHTRMPVYRDSIDDVVGVIHTKDLARHAVESGSIKDWRKLIRPMLFVNEGMTADRLLATMREKRTTQAMVMDEFGGVAGLVTLEDVLTHVFGEVGDEFSEVAETPERLADGVVRLPGRLKLDEVEEWIGTAWHGNAATVAGLITEHVGQIPEVGAELTIEGVDLTVEAVENHVVTAVLARAVETRGDATDG